MTKMASLKGKLMENPAFRQEYGRADAEYSIVEALIQARKRKHLSQEEVAKRIGTTQSAIARFEGGRTVPSMGTLRKYAEATGSRLRVELEPL